MTLGQQDTQCGSTPLASVRGSWSGACGTSRLWSQLWIRRSFHPSRRAAQKNVIKRPDFEDQTGTVESYDAGAMRYAVRVRSSGERTRVLERCLWNGCSVLLAVDMT